MSDSVTKCNCGLSNGSKDGGDTTKLDSIDESFKDTKSGLSINQSILCVVGEDTKQILVRKETVIPVLNSLVYPDLQLVIENELTAKLLLYIDVDPETYDEGDFASEAIDNAKDFLIDNGLEEKWVFDETSAHRDIWDNSSNGTDIGHSYKKVYRTTPDNIKSISSTILDGTIPCPLEQYAAWQVTIILNKPQVNSDDEDDIESESESEGDDTSIPCFGNLSKKCKKRSIRSFPQSKPPSPKREKR